MIFSSRIIPGNELAIFELHNKLSALGVEVLTEQDHFVHVSGHPCRDELAQMYRWVRPQIAVPVHGELRHMSEHARLARSLQVPQAVVIENGHMLRLAPGRARDRGRGAVGPHVSRRPRADRRGRRFRARAPRHGYAGLIAITLVVDGKGRVAAEPSFIIEGIPEPVHAAIRDGEGALPPQGPKGRRGRLRKTCAGPPAAPPPMPGAKSP